MPWHFVRRFRHPGGYFFENSSSIVRVLLAALSRLISSCAASICWVVGGFLLSSVGVFSEFVFLTHLAQC